MIHDDEHAGDSHWDDHVDDRDQVGTIEVQILLSWFFEGADPNEVLDGQRRAA